MARKTVKKTVARKRKSATKRKSSVKRNPAKSVRINRYVCGVKLPSGKIGYYTGQTFDTDVKKAALFATQKDAKNVIADMVLPVKVVRFVQKK
jgi:hypothetical protein